MPLLFERSSKYNKHLQRYKKWIYNNIISLFNDYGNKKSLENEISFL